MYSGNTRFYRGRRGRKPYVRVHEVIEPLLSLGGVVERNQLLLHVLILGNVVLDEMGRLLSQLRITRRGARKRTT